MSGEPLLGEDDLFITAAVNEPISDRTVLLDHRVTVGLVSVALQMDVDYTRLLLKQAMVAR